MPLGAGEGEGAAGEGPAGRGQRRGEGQAAGGGVAGEAAHANLDEGGVEVAEAFDLGALAAEEVAGDQVAVADEAALAGGQQRGRASWRSSRSPAAKPSAR